MSTDPTQRFITTLRDEADRSDFTDLAMSARPVSAPGLFARARNRVAVVAATSLLSIGGLTGVAVAANGAAPGDLLYGIDRALEVVGIGNGGATERLLEAQQLAGHGRYRQGLEHAADAVGDDAGAREALLGAAEQVEANSPVGEPVATMLRYLAENHGAVDGAEVARLAQEIRTHAGTPDGAPAGPPDGTPAGPPDGAPVGPPDGAPVGPPDSAPVGPPDVTPAGPPDGKPAGPPEGTPGQGGPGTTVPAP